MPGVAEFYFAGQGREAGDPESVIPAVAGKDVSRLTIKKPYVE